jgi:hypothetical protein
MRSTSTASEWAAERVAEVRDDPPGRLVLLERIYRHPAGDTRRHRPYQRAARSFIGWQLQRGVLAPDHAPHPGSPWWRAVNEALLRDGCETVALLRDHPGVPSSPAVQFWLAFAAEPTAATWYRAHNASVLSAYLEHQHLAVQESRAERFFMNVVASRVMYAHALVAAPGLAVGWLRPFAGLAGDPRLGTIALFLALPRILPQRYPLDGDVGRYLRLESGPGRMLDYGVIRPRLAALTAWSARELEMPAICELMAGESPAYAWPDDAELWAPPPSRFVDLAHRLLPAPAPDPE